MTRLIVFLLLFSCIHTIKAEEHLWPQTKQENKAGVRWWWLGSAVDKDNLTWNMEQMASHGIGAVEITPLYGVEGNDENNIEFLSPRWMEMLRHVMTEGKRLGIQIDMNCGTGWPFGGPEVAVSDAACKLTVIDTLVTRKQAKTIKLNAPEKESSYAKLIACQQFKTKKKGMVRVIAWFESRTRQKVKRAAPGGEGWVIDHFDRNAVQHYLERFTKAFETTGTPYPSTFFNDSYEVYKADWTPTLLEEFKARRGYDLLSKMQEFTDGEPFVISDYRETLGELLLENFTQQWADWAHSHGVKVRNQAHGSPANLIDVYAAVDIPEIEGFGLSEFGINGLRQDPGFTRKNYSDISMLKYAPSAAHVTGKPLASSETFTWLTEHFRTSLSQMKPDLDLMFCAGVNRIFFHGACYSPKDEPWPGWRFYASVDITPNNTIWRDAPELMSYIERCQSWLQHGTPDNDFIVLLPLRNIWRSNTKSRLMTFDIHHMDSKAPEFIQSILTIDSLGYDCDYISEQLLLQTKYADGYIHTAGGTKYRALIIPDSKTIMTEEVRRHIENLRQQGAHIIYDIDAQAMAKAAKAEQLKTICKLHMIRRRTPLGKPFYFISNLTPDDISGHVPLAVSERHGIWYNPLNGETHRAEFDNSGRLSIAMRSGESGILLLTDSDDMSLTTPPSLSSFEPLSFTTGKWKLSFTEEEPKVSDTFELETLTTWETLADERLHELMGTGIYETSFSTEKIDNPGKMMMIDLGDVRESARVYINNTYIGTAWCHPMTLCFNASILKPEGNTLRIEVTNLPANRIAAYDRRGVKWRKFNEINVVDINYKKTTYDQWKPVPSGLNSDIRLYIQK